MISIREAVQAYVKLRRALGFKMNDTERALGSFASFMEENHASVVTSTLALQWATQNTTSKPARWAARLACVRGFARHWSAIDPRTEVPAQHLLPFKPKRIQPRLYSDEEIDQLLKAALRLLPQSGLRPWTYHAIFGLLAVTGLRIGEAVALEKSDVDLQTGLLLVREAKLRKSRLVPLHESTVCVLKQYAERRDRLYPDVATQRFFRTDRGRQIGCAGVRSTFDLLRRELGFDRCGDARRPRIHDLRHTFAVSSLIRWYRNGDDIDRKMPVLSAYLGHGDVNNTYWYLTGCPELMGMAVGRLEERWRNPR
ncbi:MAG: tyrosine-type recombinase/integrase [Bryobacteraceae bacterium]